ncbi:unnamed protein product [Cutaneotrichosporon oleaginosum]
MSVHRRTPRTCRCGTGRSRTAISADMCHAHIIAARATVVGVVLDVDAVPHVGAPYLAGRAVTGAVDACHPLGALGPARAAALRVRHNVAALVSVALGDIASILAGRAPHALAPRADLVVGARSAAAAAVPFVVVKVGAVAPPAYLTEVAFARAGLARHRVLGNAVARVAARAAVAFASLEVCADLDPIVLAAILPAGGLARWACELPGYGVAQGWRWC